MQYEHVTVRVPGTSANLGPGYDALGVALQIYNDVSLHRVRTQRRLPPMVAEAAARFFDMTGLKPFPFTWEIQGAVPQSRGLGSSVTVRLGVLNGINVIANKPCDKQQIFELCAELEGHPDNAAPAQFGGFTVAADGGRWFRFEVEPKLKFVLVIPDFEVRTEDARKVLPAKIPHRDAVSSAARSAAIAAAFATRSYKKLTGLFEDGLHQPYRASLIPGLFDVIGAGVEAGALGGFLSGSGSTIACVTLRKPEVVASAMASALRVHQHGNSSVRTHVTVADNRGCRVILKH